MIFYNNISLHVHEYHISNLSILGTARYCKEWTEVQKSFYPKINALFKNNNLNVLFLLEKSNDIKIDTTMSAKRRNMCQLITLYLVENLI